MKQPPISSLYWIRKSATEKACLEDLARRKWPNGFAAIYLEAAP